MDENDTWNALRLPTIRTCDNCKWRNGNLCSLINTGDLKKVHYCKGNQQYMKYSAEELNAWVSPNKTVDLWEWDNE